MSGFESEKKAKEKLELQQIVLQDKFCPVFKEKCKGDSCMSFAPGGTRNGYSNEDKNRFFINSPICMSPLVDGTIQIDGAL